MKKAIKYIFNNKVLASGALILSLGIAGCSDYLDKEPMSEYLSSNFYNNDGAIAQGANGCYQRLLMDHSNTSSIPYCILWDMYTPYGIERADNSSIGVGNIELRTNFTVEQTWAILYTSVARCNSVLDGAKPFYNELSDKAKIYLAEIQVLRSHYYIQLVSLWGDIPYFTSAVTEEQTKQVSRTPWKEVVDDILKTLDEAADILPWTAANYGRADKSVALGLKARLALYAGSWCKFGFGMDGEKDQAKATEYFKIAAAASKKVIDESGRDLATNYADLFTRTGQLKEDVKKETMLFMMFSNQIHSFTQYMSLGEQVRMIGQSGRFPTQQLVDTYEMKNGKRIDETGSGYDPKKPFDSRDPRLKETVYTHHDVIIGNTGGDNKMKFLMEVYNPQTTSWDKDGNEKLVANLDYAGAVAQYGYVSSGVGFAWKKYNHFDDEANANPSYNILIMRFAEILLTYAEAKIELNELDATVVNAIDRVRARVDMPGILSVDPTRENDQLKMRQIVRRERKVELAKEALMLFDMRRWRTGDIQNAEPTYGYPKATGVDPTTGKYPDGYEQATPDMVPSYGASGSDRDINDIASYAAYGDKLRSRDKGRSWNNRHYLWPIPQTERNKCPWLEQNKGYGE